MVDSTVAAEKAHGTSTPTSGIAEKIENMTEHTHIGSYGDEQFNKVQRVHTIDEDELPGVHQNMNPKLALALTAMSFLWIGSQIPLYIFGSILPLIYSEIGGAAGRYVWMVIGYLIPLAAVCPFVGFMSDIFGRKKVAIVGQILLVIGPIVVCTAKTINVGIGGMVIAGAGAGLNELIALAGTSELVPLRKRSAYVGAVVCTIAPFCASGLYSQLIALDGSWRWNGLLVAMWNFIGLILVAFCYQDPARNITPRPTKEILAEVDWVGAFLSIFGVMLFMMGMQWGAQQYSWISVHTLVPFCIGAAFIIAFFVWELGFAKYPIVPARIFAKDKRTMIVILFITFLSGGNFFAILLFWPTQAHNMYQPNGYDVGIRTLPIGFGIIGGAVLSLASIGLTRGRTRILMIFWTSMMTAFTGAMSVATPFNLYPTVYAILSLAAIGVGGVIIPCSIIAQIVCPTDLIGTITAITLSIRYIGGAIGFSVYYNLLYHKFYATTFGIGFQAIVDGFFSNPQYQTVYDFVAYAAQAQYADLENLIKYSPDIADDKRAIAFDYILSKTQEQFALAYRWPYWCSIAFGGACVILSFFLRDVRQFM